MKRIIYIFLGLCITYTNAFNIDRVILSTDTNYIRYSIHTTIASDAVNVANFF